MRKIREILRLHLGEGLRRRQVGAGTGSPYWTVADHLARAGRAGLGWPLPDWPQVHRELQRPGVTLQLI